MTYLKHTWADGPDGETPITAAELNHMEDGIADAVSPEQLTEAVNTLVATDGAQAIDISTLQSQVSVNSAGVAANQAVLNTATSLATADAVAKRDPNGRMQAASPNAPSDVATKQYTDTKIATDISAAVAGLPTSFDYASLPAGSTVTVIKSGSWPARPTARADVIVAWKGADPSPSVVSSGTGGMRDGIDYRLVTP